MEETDAAASAAAAAPAPSKIEKDEEPMVSLLHLYISC